jgi:hypothetical protein
MPRRFFPCLLFLLFLTLAACASETPAAQISPTPAAAPAEAEPTPAGETFQPTAESAEEVPAATTTLPAPLYFLALGEESPIMQVWRMERDGESTIQLTNEEGSISEFDVSPVDGSIVYVGGRQLVLADASGARQTVLYETPLEQDIHGMTISNPLWTPDGQAILFSHKGIQRVGVGGGEAEMLIADDPWPAEGEPFPATGVRSFRPHSWSPDGSTLLIWVFYAPEGAAFALMDPATGAFQEFQTSDGETAYLCCNATWSPSGETLLFASDVFVHAVPGLARADTRTGVVERLITGDMSNDDFAMTLIHSAKLSDDNAIYGWRRQMTTEEDFATLMDLPLVLHRVPLDQVADPDAWEISNPSGLFPVEILWTTGTNVRGAVVANGFSDTPEYGSDLYWVPANAGSAVPLNIIGSRLRWGPVR